MSRQNEKKRSPHGGIGRREVLKGLGAGGAVAAFPLVLTPRKTAAAIKLTVRDPGGPYEKALGEAFYRPFNEMMKGEVEVTGVVGQHEPTSMVKSMVETGTYTWDIAGGLSLSAHDLLVEQGFLEKLELDDDPEVQEIPAEFRTPYLLGYEVFTTVLAYRTDVYPERAPAPEGGWKDLWDIERIPGVRALRKHAFDTTEQALMADGVPMAEVYDYMRANGMDRAYKKLDEIKPEINIWWTGGAQTSQLLATGEVDICPTWNGRAQAAIEGGAPVKISWAQSLWSVGGMTILKGGPNIDMCRKFIKFCANAERQAEFGRHIAYGPTNPNAYKHLSAERAAILSTAPQNLELGRKVDNTFWGAEKDKAMERFEAWLVG